MKKKIDFFGIDIMEFDNPSKASEFMVEPIHGEKPRLVIPTKIELEQMSERYDEMIKNYANRVKFGDIKSAKIKHFISCSDIYAVVFGYVYNSINETYPTIEDIKHEYKLVI